MGQFLKIFAWTIAVTSAMVIVFVKAPAASPGTSGGEQAGKIIEASGGALTKVINSLQGN